MRKLVAVAVLACLPVPAWLRPREPRAARAAFVRIDWGSNAPDELSRPPDLQCSEEIRIPAADGLGGGERVSVVPEAGASPVSSLSSSIPSLRKPDPRRTLCRATQ